MAKEIIYQAGGSNSDIGGQRFTGPVSLRMDANGNLVPYSGGVSRSGPNVIHQVAVAGGERSTNASDAEQSEPNSRPGRLHRAALRLGAALFGKPGITPTEETCEQYDFRKMVTVVTEGDGIGQTAVVPPDMSVQQFGSEGGTVTPGSGVVQSAGDLHIER